MVKKQTSRRQRNIKNKLMAAVCMLLVSSIMMVSTTYAWFTLSTAPEVKGITTAVGANGNLEMALLPKDGLLTSITSTAGDGNLAIEGRNVTWGNLVDLSDTSVYGLDKITLFPSALNLDTATNVLATALLKTPAYGADGRVSNLLENTVTGYYDSGTKNFLPDNEYGVRAVGTASGMTDRQLDYRNAQSAGNNAKAYAQTLAAQSLNTNGSALADIAIAHAVVKQGTTESYTQADVTALKAIVSDLEDEILPQIETAYLQYILAFAASAAISTEDTVWTAVKGAINAEDATLTSVIDAIGSSNLPAELTTAIAQYNATVANVAAASAELDALTGDNLTWSQISTPMQKLADTSKMKINGFTIEAVKADPNLLVNSVLQGGGGLELTLETGAGVYADIADQCGDFTASITIKSVEYGGLSLANVTARMVTKTSVNPVYLDAIGTAVVAAKAPASGTDTNLPITDMYGYIIDMAFRTNAAESNLLLQVEAADRIYSDNTNEETMGGGSSMTFKATTTDFSDDQVKNLMKAIRIVFFNPNGRTVIATAKLDADHATLTADGWKANMYLYTAGAGTTTTQYVEAIYVANGDDTYREKTDVDTDVELFAKVDDYYIRATHVSDGAGGYTAVTDGVGGTHVAVTATGADNETVITDNKIMPLTQNTATALSMLVYLDGNVVGNDDVAATAASSMTGKMNIQFASSANLVPMEYADLHQGTGSGSTNATTMTAVTAADASYKISSAAFIDKTIAVKLADSSDAAITTGTVTFTVAGNAAPYTATYANGVWSATVTETLAADTAVTVSYTA